MLGTTGDSFSRLCRPLKIRRSCPESCAAVGGHDISKSLSWLSWKDETQYRRIIVALQMASKAVAVAITEPSRCSFFPRETRCQSGVGQDA